MSPLTRAEPQIGANLCDEPVNADRCARTLWHPSRTFPPRGDRWHHVLMSKSPASNLGREHGEPPELLYHYTSTEGLLGIVSSGCFWATDAEFLNDAQELQYGRAEPCAALMRQAQQLSPLERTHDESENGSRAAVLRSCVDFLRMGPSNANADHLVPQVFVACFCEEADLLSQWRSYGANGGYAIGFRSRALNIFSAEYENSPTRLARVAYGAAAQALMIDEVLNDIAPYPVAHPGAHGWAAGTYLALPALARVKHDAFSEEKEWRLLQTSDLSVEQFKFIPGNYAVTPYIEVPFGHARAIAEIWVGPGSNTELRVLGVKRLLASRGLQNTGVRTSRAPFRG